MNKAYIIVPAILLAVFGYTYKNALNEMQAKEVALKAQSERKKADEKKHKDEVEARATLDAKKRQDEREAADKAKEDKKIREYDDVMKTLKDEASKYSTEADKLSKNAADLEIEISQARTAKELLNRETFDLSKQVEQDKINRRNAEIEIQRVIEIVGKKLNDNNVIVPPPPPITPPAK